MKIPIEISPNNLDPNAEVHSHTGPPRAYSKVSAKGCFFTYLSNVLYCIKCYVCKLLPYNSLQYKLPYNLTYVVIVLALLIGFPSEAKAMPITGIASWYSSECCKFNKSPECTTASGQSLYKLEKNHESFAASYDFPLGTRVKVTNLGNAKSTIVRILDRGPNHRLNRKIDLGKASFAEIADPKKGVIRVSTEVLS